jgi:predicted dienelactone hydrolase
MSIRKLLKILACLTVAVPLSICLLLGLLYVEHNKALHLPHPTGPYAVGRLTGLLEDSHQTQLLSPNRHEIRRAVVWAWYPADATPSSKKCDYLPANWREALDHTRGAFIRDFLTVDLARVEDQSLCGVGPSSRRQTYPVILLRAGASALTVQYTVLAEDLASHGYIVIGFDAPYRSEVVALPDGSFVKRLPANDGEALSGERQNALGQKLVTAWEADTGWVLDKATETASFAKLRDRLDLQKIGMVGHSLGGATAAQFCRDDPRCRAGVDIDGVVFGSVVSQGMNKPFFLLLGDHSGEKGEDARRISADLQSLYDHLPSETRLRTTLAGANHFNFSDNGFLKSRGLQQLLRLLGVMKMDADQQSRLTASYVRTFLDVHMMGASAVELRKLPPS